MAIVALLFNSTEASPAGLTVAGLAVIERQVRQVRLAGASRVYILHGDRGYGAGVVNIDHAAMLVPRLKDGEIVLAVAAGLVAGEQIIASVIAAAGCGLGGHSPVIATWPPAAARCSVERIDALTFAAGVATYPAALVRRTASELGDWDLSSTLLRAALSDAACERLDLTTVLPGSASCALVATPDVAAAATEAVLAATAQPRPDALGRCIYPVIEHAILRLIAPTRIAPFAIAAIVGALGIAATVAFAAGWFLTALALALLVGPLQDTARRLARARVLPWPRQGWHTLASMTGYSWWLAFAIALALARGNSGPMAVAALLISAQLTAASEARFALWSTEYAGEPVDAIDRRTALLAANRDSLALLLVPFALTGQWYAGLIALTTYAAASFAVTHARFLQRLQRQA